jgi:uncharacterized protein (TIGR03067 family)
MKRCLVLVTVVASAAWAGGAGGNAERKALQGTWKPVAADYAGAKIPQGELNKIMLQVVGDEYIVHADKAVDRGTVKIDAGKKPKAMDITGTDGPNKGKTMLAIFELEKDTLRVCYDLQGKERPTEFSSSKEKPYFLVTYKRTK